MSQAANAQESAEDRRSEFVPVGPGGETSSAEALLISAYIVMWALIFGLIFASIRRQRRQDERLTELESALARREASSAAASDEATV